MTAELELIDVSVHHRAPGGRGARLAAVDTVSCAIEPGELPGLVGESGSGKTTLARAILALVPLTGGAVQWQGRRIDGLSRRRFRPLRRELQLVFQDPHASLDPRMTMAESIAEPLRALVRDVRASLRMERARALMHDVGLVPELADRYPHQLSGGQLQRAVIARALVVRPRFVVFDEPVSALDVSVQGQIVNLIASIRMTLGLSGLFISHNLAVVARLCERIMVMYRGRIVESASRDALVHAPLHPYTRALLDAVPVIDASARARLRARPSTPALDESPEAWRAGCVFAGRCAFALPLCRASRPPLEPAAPGRLVACHRAGEWPSGLAARPVG